LFAAMVAQAAALEPRGARLVVSGTLDGQRSAAFAAHLASGQVRTVVFEDSTGGLFEVAEDYARAIRAAGADTEVHGACHAACAYAFMAGRQRRFGDDEQVHSLLIPLPSRVAGPQVRGTLVEFGAPPTAPAPGEPRQPAQGLLVTATPTLFGRVYSLLWCDGTQGRDSSRCERIDGADPFEAGMLTP